MSETTIEWTATRLPDGTSLPGYTFNPWQGCVKISEACSHCYAATLGNRFGVEWGPKARRRFASPSYWEQPVLWNRKARRADIRRKVFCASMADVFEQLPAGHPDTAEMEQARRALWALIEDTPSLDWLLLTKRPENILTMTPPGWQGGFPPNVWVGTTVEDQRRADERLPHLLGVPAVVRFLSCEPLLGKLDLETALRTPYRYRGFAVGRDGIPLAAGPHVHWVIAGGESGPGARPSHPDWFRSLRRQCELAGVAFFFKQWGEWRPAAPFVDGAELCALPTGRSLPTVDGPCQILQGMQRVGKKAAGRLLDGEEWSQFPTVHRARQEAAGQGVLL